MRSTIKQEIAKQLDLMPAELQQRVLDFARSLAESRPKGERGRDLLRFAGWLHPESAQAIREAIEEGCERVDAHEW